MLPLFSQGGRFTLLQTLQILSSDCLNSQAVTEENFLPALFGFFNFIFINNWNFLQVYFEAS